MGEKKKVVRLGVQGKESVKLRNGKVRISNWDVD